ncbi:MAG: tRNA dihydrouridine synthase DusB [Treponema sp.]|jgi:nifR3 family TIM-barrel protein|nr:tRNA dihydrouridine synthase DusB [Treponema sp.]
MNALFHPIRIRSLVIPGNLFLAPVAGYTDRAFRSLCAEQGADFSFTELVSSEALVRGGVKTDALLRRGEEEQRYAVQLFGADPLVMYRAASLLLPYAPEAVDINCGCPVPKVVKAGAGSGLMRNPALLGRVVEAVLRASREFLAEVPVTVKLRSGWDASSLNYRECAEAAVQAGAALVSLHARTRAQGYEGRSDWSHIADLASRLEVPVVGSGDLFCPEDAEQMLRETGCAAVMFARGAMGNPFIFAQTRSLLCTGAYSAPLAVDRIRLGFRHLVMLASNLGEGVACREMRKQFCAYTKGMAGGAPLRNRLVHAETVAEYRALLQDYLEK